MVQRKSKAKKYKYGIQQTRFILPDKIIKKKFKTYGSARTYLIENLGTKFLSGRVVKLKK